MQFERKSGSLGEEFVTKANAEQVRVVDLPVDSAGGVLFRYLGVHFPTLGIGIRKEILFPTPSAPGEWFTVVRGLGELLEWEKNASPEDLQTLDWQAKEVLTSLDEGMTQALYARLGCELVEQPLAS